MKFPAQHDKAHPTWPDRWNPYQQRETFTPLLDKDFFEANLGDHSWQCRLQLDFFGCLDAPEEIPGGSTLCVRTIGGWQREAYHRLPRECTDYARHLRAEIEVGQMIKQILEETS